MYSFLFSVFAYNVGSAVLLRVSLAIISDWIRFQKNYAYQGAALQITDGSRVSIIISTIVFNSRNLSGK